MEGDGIDTVRPRATDLRARAGRLRLLLIAIATVDAEVICQLSKLADECDFLADAIDALDPDDKDA